MRGRGFAEGEYCGGEEVVQCVLGAVESLFEQGPGWGAVLAQGVQLLVDLAIQAGQVTQGEIGGVNANLAFFP